MKVSDFSVTELQSLLKRGDLLLVISPFVARLRSDVPSLAQNISAMYREFEVLPPENFADFHVEVELEAGFRRWISPLARFSFDGRRSFVPLPARQAFAMIEWGLNWCVAAHAHQYLVIHAAVIERGGRAVVLPAPPGSGKSTLCAGLINRGWRLLSDELALLDMDTGLIRGMARPVNLKNASIDVIRAFESGVVLTSPVPDTSKGTVALMRPPALSVARSTEPARPAWIVLPKFVPASRASMKPAMKARTFMLVAEQSFNYDIHGAQGFERLAAMVDGCDCYEFSYSDLNEAVSVFDSLNASERQ